MILVVVPLLNHACGPRVGGTLVGGQWEDEPVETFAAKSLGFVASSALPLPLPAENGGGSCWTCDPVTFP